jgi:hypothetical protein
MTVCNAVFNEMYKYCEWWIMRAKGGNVNAQNNEKPKPTNNTPEGQKWEVNYHGEKYRYRMLPGSS